MISYFADLRVRVTRCGLRVARCRLQVAGREMGNAGCQSQDASCDCQMSRDWGILWRTPMAYPWRTFATLLS